MRPPVAVSILPRVTRFSLEVLGLRQRLYLRKCSGRAERLEATGGSLSFDWPCWRLGGGDEKGSWCKFLGSVTKIG